MKKAKSTHLLHGQPCNIYDPKPHRYLRSASKRKWWRWQERHWMTDSYLYLETKTIIQQHNPSFAVSTIWSTLIDPTILENIKRKALGHRYFKPNVKLFSRTANSSGFETPAGNASLCGQSSPCQTHALALQRLQMNRSIAIAFAGRNSALLESTCYLFPEVNTTYKGKKERKEF